MGGFGRSVGQQSLVNSVDVGDLARQHCGYGRGSDVDVRAPLLVSGQPVSDGTIPVLWLCGPPGVGKTVVGWEIYSRLVRSGLQAGYVDIDQLGICYPASAADPGRHRMKARNLGGVVANFRADGARCLVVSGVVDASAGVPAGEIPQGLVTVCLLRADRDELARRLAGRGSPAGQIQQVLQEAADLDAGTVADVSVDTTGLAVAEVVRQVHERTGGWPAPTCRGRGPAVVQLTGRAADGPILWLCGVTGAGKSAVGFAVYQRAVSAGLMAAYVDLDQIGFSGPTVAGHPIRARNLAALWQTYRAADAQGLVVTGPAEDRAAVLAYADALPAATFTVCRLHAGRNELTRRIMLRGRGAGWRQPGDPLTGQPAAYLLRVADQAVIHAEALERAAIGLRIGTDGRTVEQVADDVVARSEWVGRV